MPPVDLLASVALAHHRAQIERRLRERTQERDARDPAGNPDEPAVLRIVSRRPTADRQPVPVPVDPPPGVRRVATARKLAVVAVSAATADLAGRDGTGRGPCPDGRQPDPAGC